MEHKAKLTKCKGCGGEAIVLEKNHGKCIPCVVKGKK